MQPCTNHSTFLENFLLGRDAHNPLVLRHHFRDLAKQISPQNERKKETERAALQMMAFCESVLNLNSVTEYQCGQAGMTGRRMAEDCESSDMVAMICP